MPTCDHEQKVKLGWNEVRTESKCDGCNLIVLFKREMNMGFYNRL